MRRSAVLLLSIVLVAQLVAAPAAGQSADYTGEIELIGNSASDGTEYQYALGDDPDISDFNISLTGVDNTATDSTSGTLSSGSPESVEVGGTIAPTNEQITINPEFEELNPSLNGSVSGSDSINIEAQGSLSLSDAQVDLQTRTDTNINNNGGQISSKESRSFDRGGSVSEIRIRAQGNSNSGYQETISVSRYSDMFRTFGMTFGQDDVYTQSESVLWDNWDGTLYINSGSYIPLKSITVVYETNKTVTVDGTDISSTGQTTVPITTGSNSISIDAPSESIDYTVSWSETNGVADVIGTVGSSTINHDGPVSTPITKSVDLSRGSNTIDLSYSGASDALDYSVSWDETTQTRDPSITINGNEAGISGTLSDGETRSLSVDPAWVESGTNNVSISTSTPTGGPGSLVGMDYSHLTTGASETITVDSTEWESTINSSKTYQSDQSGVVANLSYPDDVVSIADIEIRRNGGTWSNPSSWQMYGQTLSVDVGSVSAGETITVRGEGRRVDVLNGAIEVVDPTVEGNSLNSKIKISRVESGFGIDTTGTSPKIHYAAEESWDAAAYVDVDQPGSQIIRLPNVAEGSTTRIRRAPLSMSSSGDPVAVRIDDPDTPAWSITDQGATPDNIQIDYLDPEPLTQYEIYSLNEERSLRTAEEDDGVASFAADGRTGSYEIRESVSTAGAAVAVAGGDDGSSSPLSIVALLVGLSGSLVGALVLGRRLGVGSTRTRLGIGLLLGVVGIELATARSVLGDLILGLQISADSLASSVIGGFFDSGAGIVVIGILILISLVIIRRRVGLPDWLLVSGGLLVGIFVIDEISGGLLTGALDELGPLVWILLLIGGGVLLYRVLAPRPINIGGNS